MGTPKPAALNVYLDSDGPVADFDLVLKADGRPADVFKHEPGIYLWLPVTPGAARAIGKLKTYDDRDELRVWILTKTPSNSPYAYTEKILWYRRNFPWLEDRVILTHDKHLMGTEHDFLLDDRPHKANASKFRGTFCLFDTENAERDWEAFVNSVTLRLRTS
jgi:5'(3')-deoxyribonucleotidase